jgi:hypothetical protein
VVPVPLLAAHSFIIFEFIHFHLGRFCFCGEVISKIGFSSYHVITAEGAKAIRPLVVGGTVALSELHNRWGLHACTQGLPASVSCDDRTAWGSVSNHAGLGLRIRGRE